MYDCHTHDVLRIVRETKRFGWSGIRRTAGPERVRGLTEGGSVVGTKTPLHRDWNRSRGICYPSARSAFVSFRDDALHRWVDNTSRKNCESKTVGVESKGVPWWYGLGQRIWNSY